MNEHKIVYQYNATAIRQHTREKHFPEGTIDETNTRRNLYQVEAVFKLPISPRRGLARKQSVLQRGENS